MRAAVSRAAVLYAQETTEAAFAGRRGHGGGPVTHRQLTRRDLAALLAIAFEAGRRAPAEPERTA